MRIVTLLCLVGFAASALAATRSAPPSADESGRYRRPGPHYPHYPHYPRPYRFSMEILSEGGSPRAESSDRGTPYIQAREGEAYSIRLHNPLPVRAGVNLCVDGLNTINGKPSRPSEGPLWVLDPGQAIEISGWQVDRRHARRFVFTTRGDSYARWQDRQYGTDRARETGKITAAFFWSQAELDARERPRWTQDFADRRGPAPASRANRLEEKDAGTGMGERIGHGTIATEFNFDRGMYNPEEAITVLYGFASRDWDDRHPHHLGGFAPEMPER
jgi:hypothetical protein